LDISISLTNDEFLHGFLNIPPNPKSIIIFAHGSGSSGSLSPRNKHVADVLNDNGFATLLVDLLSQQEQESDIKSQKIMGRFPGIVFNKFNINLLSNRLTAITNWIIKNDTAQESLLKVKDLPLGYFGASTGAAAAIETTATSNQQSNKIYAIVSRGGRPDLASSDSLNKVKAATLLIVGAKDSKDIISFNKKSLKQLKNAKNKELIVIPNAGHLFDEDESLMEKVADITKQWFLKNLYKNIDKKGS
jgi:putative phosphoribosyl transferase